MVKGGSPRKLRYCSNCDIQKLIKRTSCSKCGKTMRVIRYDKEHGN